MHRLALVLCIALACAAGALEAFAMEAQRTRLAVWRKGETIAGEEFIAATEAVVDYIATLRRPTEQLKAIRYDCQAKVRYIRPTVQQIGSAQNTQWTEIRTVYELRDCVELAD